MYISWWIHHCTIEIPVKRTGMGFMSVFVNHAIWHPEAVVLWRISGTSMAEALFQVISRVEIKALSCTSHCPNLKKIAHWQLKWEELVRHPIIHGPRGALDHHRFFFSFCSPGVCWKQLLTVTISWTCEQSSTHWVNYYGRILSWRRK